MARPTGALASDEIRKHLKDVDFPADRHDLVRAAENDHAPGEVVEALRGLPDQEYARLKDVMEAYARIQ